MIVATDLSDLAIFRPSNKKDVGRRLALRALAATVGAVLEIGGQHVW